MSGRAAAHLLGLLKGRPPGPEVTTPLKRRVAGVTVRRGRLEPADCAVCRGVPVTAVPRTLTDLPLDDLARACHEAGVRYGTTPAHVAAVLVRRPRCPGSAKLRRILHGDAPVTLSALERRFLELLREHGLPLPATNRRAGAHRVDCRWPERRLTVELDSYRFHSSRHAWEQDRRRERPRRRAPAVHLGRRVRGPGPDARRAPPPPARGVTWSVGRRRFGILAGTQDAP